MRVFHVDQDQFTELPDLPEALPARGYYWIGSARREFELRVATLQAALQRWTGGQIVDLHVSDLLNSQLPSHFDYTSWYDLLVFRRLAAGAGSAIKAADGAADGKRGALAAVQRSLDAIDTSPVGFALFDRVLLTVHPDDCSVREFFANRLSQQAPGPGDARSGEARTGGRMPSGPADLMLRMVNHMVDSYLELRRALTRQFGVLEQELIDPRGGYANWRLLLQSRNALHLLEDTCEDQRSALIEWIDALDEWPDTSDAAVKRERELLRLRSRDVVEHIERVLTHVRRLENSAETAVQMHFSAQSHRTNNIMRTLTVLTAIFLPLNLVTGFFGMNFEGLPLIHSARGFWIVFGVMLAVGVGLSVFFWRKNYLQSSR